MDAVLDFLEERRLADVLANPTIVTLNNIRARIEIISQYPYISAQQTGQNSIGRFHSRKPA
jgi:type II secretory pathway component GspD/PulD (secretin)